MLELCFSPFPLQGLSSVIARGQPSPASPCQPPQGSELGRILFVDRPRVLEISLLAYRGTFVALNPSAWPAELSVTRTYQL
jgi:hypothetical protein